VLRQLSIFWIHNPIPFCKSSNFLWSDYPLGYQAVASTSIIGLQQANMILYKIWRNTNIIVPENNIIPFTQSYCFMARQLPCVFDKKLYFKRIVIRLYKLKLSWSIGCLQQLLPLADKIVLQIIQ
jgi:hypothetical protein